MLKQGSRRDFLKFAALAAPVALAGGCRTTGSCGGGSGKPVKVCVFADLHYYPGVWTNTEDTSFLERILARAEQEQCDFVIHLGDFMHGVKGEKAEAFMKLYASCRVPTYHILGNHDQDGNDWRETVEAYRMPGGYYSFDCGGFRFVVADPNYFCNEPGKFIHHSKGNYFKRVKGSTINWIPPEQLEWMRSVIVGSPYPCVVLSHQSFERPPVGGGVMNKDAVQAMFREANAKRPGTVRVVMNGHLHCDNLRILDNILYWDVTSANYEWFDDAHDKYPADYLKTHTWAQHNIGWTDPLSAILTLWPDGRVKIDGSKSEFLFGVSPEVAGLPVHDKCGRYTLPIIQSADFTFNY